MADESTDISSKEELSRWIENGKAVEHFLGIVHAKEVIAKALTQYLLDFLQERGIPIQKLRGLGFDGASAMSGSKGGVQIQMRYHSPSALYAPSNPSPGSKGGVQIQMRYHSPSALYVHCRCHRLQLAAVYTTF